MSKRKVSSLRLPFGWALHSHSHLKLLVTYLEMCEREEIDWKDFDIKPLRISRTKAATYARILEVYSSQVTWHSLAQELDIGASTVSRSVLALVEAGWLPARILQKGQPRRHSDQDIIDLYQEGLGVKDIRVRLGYSKVGLYYRVKAIAGHYGKDVLAPTNPTISMTVASEILQTSLKTLKQQCEEAGIIIESGAAERRKLGQEDIAFLAYRLEEQRSLTCEYCQELFVAQSFSRKRFCSRSCSDKASNVRKFLQSPRLETLRGYTKEVWLALKNRNLPENEEWVEPIVALKLSGLEKMYRLTHLRMRQILQTQAHPSKTSPGGSVNLFARSELELVCEVYEKTKAKPH